jgi:hypothetical protein
MPNGCQSLTSIAARPGSTTTQSVDQSAFQSKLHTWLTREDVLKLFRPVMRCRVHQGACARRHLPPAGGGTGASDRKQPPRAASPACSSLAPPGIWIYVWLAEYEPRSFGQAPPVPVMLGPKRNVAPWSRGQVPEKRACFAACGAKHS